RRLDPDPDPHAASGAVHELPAGVHLHDPVDHLCCLEGRPRGRPRGGTRSRRGRPSRRKACGARRASLIRIDRGNGAMLMLKKVLAVAAMVAILGVPALATEQADHSTQGKPVVVPTATSNLGMALG